jgi:hypothetical protein
MSSTAALTILAVAVATLAVVVLGGVAVLLWLAVYLRRLERSLRQQWAGLFADLQEVFGHVKSASRQVEVAASRSESLFKAVGTAAVVASAFLLRRQPDDAAWKGQLLRAAGRGAWQWFWKRRRRQKAGTASRKARRGPTASA